MTPDEYRQRALVISAATAAAVNNFFQFLPLNPGDTIWRRFIDTIYPIVMRGRLDVFNLTTDYYMSNRPTQDDPPEFVERSYPPKALEKALARPRARLMGLAEFQAEEARIAAEQAKAIVDRHVLASGRESVVDTVEHDDKALGYARVPSGLETCAFCMMLVSRGPVYKTFRSAKFRADGQKYHDDCDCEPVAVFDKNDWPDRDRFIEAEKLWHDATGGHSGKAALNALRRHLYAQSSAS